MHAWGFTVRNEGGETVEIDVYDVVGDGWFYGSVSARSVRNTLKAQKNAKLIKLRINSEGGDVFDGFAIYNLLNEHPARVEVDIDALAASVASIIAMAADEVRIASNAWLMIHNAWGAARGEAEDLRRWGDVLEKMSGQAAEIYAARSGLSLDEIRELMDAETWMTAEEALKRGFVDKVIPAKKSSAQASARAFARMAVDDYRNVPPAVRALAEQARASVARRSTPEPGAPDNNNPGTEKNMNRKVLAQALGISESATDEAFEAAAMQQATELRDARAGIGAAKATLAGIEKATGKTGDEVLGVVLAWKGSHEELPKLTEKVTKLEADAESSQLDAAITKAKAENRHTPARETEVRELLKNKDLTVAGAKAMVGTWGVVSALAAGADGAKPGTGGAGSQGAGAGSGQLTWNGKTYAQLSSAERSKLHSENPELFAAMRKQASDAGEI